MIFQPHSRATLFSLHSKPHRSPPCISPTDTHLVVQGMTNLPDLSTNNTIIVSLTPYYIPILTHCISTNTPSYFHLLCIHSHYQTRQFSVIIHILHVCECVCTRSEQNWHMSQPKYIYTSIYGMAPSQRVRM